MGTVDGRDGSGRGAWFAAGLSAMSALATAMPAGQQVFHLEDSAGWAPGDLAFIAEEARSPEPDGPAAAYGQAECLGPVVEVEGVCLRVGYAALRDWPAGAPLWRPCRWAGLPPDPVQWAKRWDDGMERVTTLDGQRRNLQVRNPGETLLLRHARVTLAVWRGLTEFLRAPDGAAWGARDFTFAGWDRHERRWAVDRARLISGMPEFRELALGWPGLEMELQIIAPKAWTDGTIS